ncbi:MAG: hypothetical protein AAF679_03635 [Pseudomonadota bacterium]
MKLGVLALGRPTFDVPYAQERLAAMWAALEAQDVDLVGTPELLMDADATLAALDEVRDADQLLILQVTFTDAAMTLAIAEAFSGPLSIWAVPEPRLGGRLRLNAFCGLNLASHALSVNDRPFGWLYADPDRDVSEDLAQLIAGHRAAERVALSDAGAGDDTGRALVDQLAQRKVARIGAHPEGFTTCAYDADAVRVKMGVEVDALSLDTLFDAATGLPNGAEAPLHTQLSTQVEGLGDVDQTELSRSLRLKLALDQLRSEGRYDGFALRCWPETFTEYGGAICGPAGLLNEARVPCACEADVWGTLTQLLLQDACEAPVFLADLVDMDLEDNTGVVWHCGQAPASMATGQMSATVHTNRKMPLLYEFTLKPGPVTFLRLSQARGTPQMILGFGEVLERPMAFTGTSGVVRFDKPAHQILKHVIDTGLEHHMALAYGDHRAVLRSAAAHLDLPIYEL